jgi:tetratricopeptide (TPR) repeat protein
MNKRRTYCSILVLSVVFSSAALLPQQTFGQTKKGIELYDAGKYREAERVLQEALKTDPSDISASFYLGLSMLVQENYRGALDTFLKVQEAQGKAGQGSRPFLLNKYQIQIALARARLGLRQYAEAWKNLESARSEDARSSDVYVYRGVYYLQQEKYKEAIQELEKAITLDSRNPYAYYYSGLAYYRSGDGVKAVDALKTFIELAPYAPEAGKAKSIIDSLC